MNPEIKAKWIEALRSGNFSQTKMRLRDTDGYCCLGVLCEIVDPGGWHQRIGWLHHDEEGMPGSDVYEAADLLEDWAGELSSMNDDGKSFAEIADHIEKNL